MNDDILERIRKHVAVNRHETRCAPSPLPLPASQDAVRAAEEKLQFRLPALLKAVYSEIANGGIGPGYGLIGLTGGHLPNDETLVATYEGVHAGAAYLGFEWQRGLLPFCEWGCNILSCIDCMAPEFPMYVSEACEVTREPYSLEEFFEMWMDGVDILGVNTEPGSSVEVINPFTRKKMWVSTRRRRKK
jgi:hypothetical protein